MSTLEIAQSLSITADNLAEDMAQFVKQLQIGQQMPSNPLRVGAYHLPVTGDPGEWYFAGSHKPPTCAGLTVFAEQARGTYWGNLVVKMSLDDDGPIYWRYAHCQDVFVKRGDFVRAGQQIATIGKGYNDRYYAHLHLDACRKLQEAGEWGTADVEWLDPLGVWRAAGYDWEWGSA
jgi:hypothetical protein